MCGVVGVFHYGDRSRAVDQELLQQMTRVLWHRGPDDEGIWTDGPVGLGHRRLSIVDLSPSGHQPMKSADGQAVISYNGEFYNHQDYRGRLRGRGVSFRGTSDTETLLELVAAEGPSALTDVAGIFAFAIWDRKNDRLLLARDPLGVKQLYYHDDGKRIVFASEIKALLVRPDVPKEVDPEAVNQYLHFHTPLFDRTFFKGIRQLRAGHWMEVDRHGPREHQYWRVDDFEPREETPEQAVEALQSLIADVTREQLMSDVPVGAFFSGGIDSSAIAAFAKRVGRPLLLFGIHFTDQGVIDERPFQERTARALGLELELTTLDGSTFPDDLMRLSWYQDQPVIGAAMLPMYHVSRLAARRVKVCLGGQAADEIFGGYARYALADPWKVLRSWVSNRRRPNAGSGNAQVGGNLGRQLREPRYLLRVARAALQGGLSWRTRYFENFAKVPARDWQGLLAGEFVSRKRARASYDAGLQASGAHHSTDLVMHWDQQTYLTGLFQQDDRMSMANSLESRVPFADPRLVRFAFRTHRDLKMRAGASKWVLREAVADVLPEDVLNRRKVGFDTPAEQWMKHTHKDFVRDLLLSSAARTRGWTNPSAVTSWLDHPNKPMWFDVVWKATMIEAWARTFLDGRPSPVPAEPPRAHG